VVSSVQDRVWSAIILETPSNSLDEVPCMPGGDLNVYLDKVFEEMAFTMSVMNTIAKSILEWYNSGATCHMTHTRIDS